MVSEVPRVDLGYAACEPQTQASQSPQTAWQLIVPYERLGNGFRKRAPTGTGREDANLVGHGAEIPVDVKIPLPSVPEIPVGTSLEEILAG